MSETSNELETTETPSLMKEMGKAAAVSAVGVAASFGTLLAIGGIVNTYQKIKAKRAEKNA